ncbi:hypothetical protein LZC95_32440 [Pendulispora brunnea]|uniref:Uncharacterized protein n=1 Tax=Pendulispora brunnea TaxID=2905690 RepID=A0ABZ2JXS2_9BACT
MAEETKKAAPLVRLVQRLGLAATHDSGSAGRSDALATEKSQSLDAPAPPRDKRIRLGSLLFTVDVQGRVETDQEVATYSARAECRRDGPEGVPHVVVNENRRQWKKKGE